MFIAFTAALCAMLVLADPDVTLDFGRVKIHFVGDTFSLDTKGAIISAILIGGWNALTRYWLPDHSRRADDVTNAESAKLFRKD